MGKKGEITENNASWYIKVLCTSVEGCIGHSLGRTGFQGFVSIPKHYFGVNKYLHGKSEKMLTTQL